jgi:formamidopyrimidine-DNA glycosylase
VPELPEVETVVRSVEPHLIGRQILTASFSSSRVTRGDHAETARLLTGATIQTISRRGKQIWMALDRGFLYIHLGMTGKLLWDGQPGKHTRALLEFEPGVLIYDDSRMFGRVEAFETIPEAFQRVGPDALDIPFAEFYTRLKQRRGRIKTTLLNQAFLGGVGNIYADEALFASRIHPNTPLGRLSKARAATLHTHVLEILNAAIVHRGSSVSDYVDGAGERGSFQQQHNVYGKAGEPCPDCGTPIRRIVVAQRGTHYCPRCQRV